MRNLVVPIVIAGFLAASPFAFAAQQANGTVKAIDMGSMTLTLADGTIYHLPQGFKDPGLKTGEKVQISWNMQNGQYDAVAVTVVK